MRNREKLAEREKNKDVKPAPKKEAVIVLKEENEVPEYRESKEDKEDN